jgi:Galactocerebrosidase, C-terminal lectin domain
MDGNRLSLFPLNKFGFAAAIAACAIACAASAGLAQQRTTMIAIEKMDVGGPPPGFEFARTGQGGPGQWVVVNDPTATGGHAIEQSSADQTDNRFPLAIYSPLSVKNIAAVVRFKSVAGKIDRAAGVVVRLIDPNNYYVVRANALEDNVRFYRVVKGRREQIEGANLKASANEWHTLGLKAEGDRFTVTFDGKQLFTTSDRTFTEAGRFALWTKADSVTRFDRIEINTLP